MSEGVVFAYRAAHRDGVLETGTLAVSSAEEARSELSSRGLFPVEVQPVQHRELRRPRLAPDDLALGLRVLATLLDAGLPLDRALAALDELAPASWSAALPAVRASVREGSSLGAALGAAPVHFPPLVVGLIRAGEAGSGLAAAVARAAEWMESSAELRRSIRSALAYPLLLAGAGIASMVLLVGFVLPRFAAILTDLGQQLPRSTRLVLAAAEAAKVGFLPATLVAAIFAVVWRLWTGTVAGEERWHEFLLSLPFLGSIRRSAAASRVAAALSALLESGVPIAPALGHAARAGGDAALSKRILASRDAVVSGASLARSLEAEHATTATMLRLIRAGEATGRLASMLARAAQLEAERTAQLMKSAVRVLEPGMILLFGVGVGLIAAALLQAVYSVRPGL